MVSRVRHMVLQFTLLLLCIPLFADEAKDESKLLEGRWDGVSVELDGTKVSTEKLKEGGWIFKGLEVEFFGPGAAAGGKASVKLDLSKTPKHIDIIGLEGPQKDKKMEGIFKVEDDQLVVCLRNAEAASKGRPTEFKTEVGSGLGMVTLKRNKLGDEPAEKKQREASSEKLKQIGIAMHTHFDAFKLLPAQSIKKDDKSLLSWRVKLLVFLGEQPLYDKFHHDEPWDSDHNKKLIEKMPAVFASPYETAEMVARGLTTYQVPVSPGSLFDEDAPYSLAQVRDGTSNTIMVVDVAPDQAVIWTKPDDWKVDAKDPLKGVVRQKGKGFHALFVDGSARLLDDAMDRENMKRFLNKDDGLPVSDGLLK